VTKENLEKIADEYHLHGDAPDMFIENSIQFYELNWVVQKVGKKSRILDLGYGDGLFLEKLSIGNELTIIEGSNALAKKAISEAERLNINVEVINIMFEDFKPEGQFDVVVASHVLEHVENPIEVLNKIKQWLSPEGKLICIVPNRESLHRRLGLKMGLINNLDDLSARDLTVGHLRVYSYEALYSDLTAAGFEVEEKRGFFLKVLSNAQMLGLTESVIEGLCKLSDDLPIEMGANLGLVATHGGPRNE
jgi:2-polyprenyl-3-methyl-5-hydroxy-6-metoxy-1,4-benzoquinol methylase